MKDCGIFNGIQLKVANGPPVRMKGIPVMNAQQHSLLLIRFQAYAKYEISTVHLWESQ